MSRKCITAAVVLMLGIVLGQAAFASYAIPDANIGNGVVQTVNDVTHSVTVAGHTYRISPKATYIKEGGGEVRGLEPGMRIRFIANGPVKDSASQITQVLVLPPAAQ